MRWAIAGVALIASWCVGGAFLMIEKSPPKAVESKQCERPTGAGDKRYRIIEVAKDTQVRCKRRI